jgi:LysR family transcriptional regulator, glycine cleavage system transcriptional activator
MIHLCIPSLHSFVLDGAICKRNDFVGVVVIGIAMDVDTKLPTLTSLRVFVSVAQLGSTTRAADIGCVLFARTPQGLTLTEAGELYRPYAEAALEQLARGNRRLAERKAIADPVRLHMLAIVGERWLMQRFPDFTAMHPEIDVQFTHYVSENESEEPDIDIRHGEGGWSGFSAQYLFGREMSFVCSPHLLERHGSELAAQDVQKLTLLQHFQMPAYWAEFTEAHGLRGAVPTHTIRYGYMSVIVKAAVAGLGFALVPRCFLGEELANGTLVELPDMRFESVSGYWLLRPQHHGQRADVDLLAQWLMAEAGIFNQPS